MLYQRYFLRMNQSNTTHILSLLMALVISLAAIHIIFMPLDSSNFSYNTIHRNDSIASNATAYARHYNQSFLLDDQLNDTSNDHANQQNNSTTTTGNSYSTSNTGNNKISETILISSHLNKDLDLHDKTISHTQKNVHSQGWAPDDISNERKR